MRGCRLLIGFLLVGMLALSGCRKVRPDDPPKQPFDTALEQPISRVAAEIEFSIPALEKKINDALGTTLVTEENFEGKKGESWKLRVERTGRIRIRYANNKVFFSAPLRILYTNPISLKKKANRPHNKLGQMTVNFSSPLTVEDNWQLGIRSKFTDYQWLEAPKVRLLGLPIDVTNIANKILEKRKDSIEASIDKAVAGELHLNKQISKIWRDMQKPLLITKKPDTLWLLPRPFSVAAAPVRGQGSRLIVPIQIAFRVDTKIGTRPVIEKLEPLPRLMKRTSVPDTSDLKVLAFIPYADLNRALDQTLKNDKLNLSKGKLNIKNATVYGNGQALVVKTDVGGVVNGTLYFQGKPMFDTLTNTFRVKQLDFDVDTQEMLTNTADWLLHDHLRDSLQNALVLPLDREVVKLPGLIENAYARGKAGQKTSLEIEGFRLVPERMVVRPEGVQMLIKAESKVKLNVKRL